MCNFKKILSLLTVMLLSVFMVACSSGGETKDESKGKDKQFIEDLGKGLKERWALASKDEAGTLNLKENEAYEKFVKVEMDAVSKYKDAEFDSPELGKLAKDYIKALEDSKESIKYYSKDELKFLELWEKPYNERSTILLTLVDKFGLKVDEKEFKVLKDNAQIVNEENASKEKIDAMVKGIKFEKVKDEYDWKTYQATVENTSDLDLQDFYLDINLIDKDGVIIDTQTSTSINGTWEKGQKVRLEFDTDKDFEKIEWTPHYSANNYSILE
ncbi:hypothetical protein C4097_10640 [Clostridioides difficile]|nr:hypothetical protein KW95_06755 [Clostridioides difficile]MDB3085006.1 hypothetical protein [Clostridioides difficile]MDI0265699.1 FxLYD domain-containing protein [Clostridioides difficile]